MAGKKTFVAGEVLLAQDVNDFLMDQTVMNFATEAARSSAIPTPTTGMVSYVGDTGSETATGATIANVPQIQAYTGAAWQNVDGLTLVARATIGSALSSVTLTNIFSANFVNYRVYISGVTASTGTDLKLQFTGGTINYFGSTSFDLFSGGVTGFNRSSAANSIFIGGVTTVNEQTSTIDISQPFLAARTSVNGTYFGNGYTGYIGGTEGSNTSLANLIIFPLAGTITGGTISVYGYRSA
jgi:hypothetical protein